MSKSRSGAPRRAAAGLLAGALAVVGLALAPPAGAVDDVTTDRIAGTTRYGTAGAFAGQDEFAGATTAILATGENFPDALAASGLAGANAPAPIVLTESNNFTDDARIALNQLTSLDDVIIVGGTAAVSEDVAEAVAEEGYAVTRLAGATRYGTAAEIADNIGAGGEIRSFDTAIIASGEVFADALAGGPVAYAAGLPILLVNTDGVPAETEQALDDANIQQVLILGGTARITEATENELESITGRDAIRVAGQDRFATAADIGRFAEAELGWGPEAVILANGLNFPDALAAGPFGGERQAPIVLSASIPDPTAEYLDEISDTLQIIFAAGGTAAVSEEDLAAAEGFAENTANDTPTGGDTQTSELEGPELQSASITGIDLDDLEVVVSYVFDTDLDEDSADESGFKLYNADTRNPATGDLEGVDADVSGETVDVTFSLADYAVVDATLAAVTEGAIDDEDGNSNPPQSVSIEGGTTGGTQGADLIGAEVTDDDEDGLEDEVTFTFSSATTEGTEGGALDRDFEVVLEDGTDVDCTNENTTPDEDESSEEIEATCPIPEDNDAVRGVMTLNGLNGSVLIQTAEIARGGNSDGPDLVSVTTPESDDDLDDDEVIFTFDEAIDSPAVGTQAVIEAFNLYYSHCDPTSAGGFNVPNPCTVAAESIEFDADEEREVIAQFPDNAVTVSSDTENPFLVGAFVEEGAVNEEGAGTITNKDDEVSISNEGFDAGDVAGPQLVSVEAVIDETAAGAFQDFEVTFTFDKAIDDDVALDDSDFSVWFDVEGETDSITLENCEYEGNDQVVCSDTDEDSDIAGGVVGAVDAGAVQSNAEYTLEDDEVSENMPNPEGSAAFESPGSPEDND